MNAVLTWASGEDFCVSAGFAAYVRSLKNIPNADFFVFTNDMPSDCRKDLVRRGIAVEDISEDKVKFLLRDRHLAFWEFMAKNRNYKNVLITDSKDVVFQRNPFDYVKNLTNYVLLAGEGMTHEQSGWNLIDQYEAQKNVKEFEKEYRDWPVVNGGVLMGSSNHLRNLLFLIWTNTVRAEGRCTDQGVLNYLYSYLRQDPAYWLKSPQHHAYCLTGEAVKEGFFKPIFKDGLFYQPVTEELYFIVHQYDRLEDVKERIYAKSKI